MIKYWFKNQIEGKIMKILFFSDTHGIIDNINAIIPHLKSSDHIVILGDIFRCGGDRRINHNYNPTQLLSILKPYQNKIIAIEGNTDYKDEPFELNLLTTMNIDGHQLFLTHGHYYQLSDIPQIKSGDVYIFGHTHQPIIKKEAGIICLNPGSLSLPKNDIASFMIYENKEFVIYDIKNYVIAKIKL